MKNKIYNFFEHPKDKFAIGFQVMIFIMIIVSVAIAFLEYFEHGIVMAHKEQLDILNHVILVVFTIEYILRLIVSPKKSKFLVKPMNVVDFVAIFPNYVELLLPFFIDTTELRVLRLIRLLRFARALRAIKLFKFGKLFKKVFRFQETILEAIFPIMVLFVIIKGAIWALEKYNLWLPNQDLGNLFAIIGFALGIILAQKVSVSYDKFVNVEEALIRLYGNLRTLMLIINSQKTHLGSKVTKDWVQNFLKLLEDPKANNFSIHLANDQLYTTIKKLEDQPADITNMYATIVQDAAFCLSKKIRITPKAYDTLLHQVTMLYLGLTAIFIPGLTGIISVITATYILYGMYHLTQDLDSIVGGEFNLINIDLSELQFLAKESA
jgi:hypothetical protein